MTIEELAARMDQQFAVVNDRFSTIDKRFDTLETKVDEGFDASRTRDEELRSLTTFGLEAREVVRDEMHRRFDNADHKHDEQISLLKDAVQHLSSRK